MSVLNNFNYIILCFRFFDSSFLRSFTTFNNLVLQFQSLEVNRNILMYFSLVNSFVNFCSFYQYFNFKYVYKKNYVYVFLISICV